MTESTTPRYPTIRVDLLHAHGSPTGYLYHRDRCRCVVCRAAMAECSLRYREDHRDAIAERRPAHDLRYRETHRTEKAESDCRYRGENREKIATANRRYRAGSPAQVAESGLQWRAKNPEYLHDYRAAHRDETAEYNRDYRATHPVEIAVHWRNRRARVRDSAGTHTATDIRAQHKRQRGRCFWCHKPAGKRRHVDHVTPLSRGGSNGPENLVISCPACNMSKHDKLPMDFAGILF